MTPDPFRVLVVGEALIDIVYGPHGVREYVGGSPANVALGLGRRGISTRLLTQIAQDPRGDTIRRHLHESGVDIDSPAVPRTSTAEARIQPDGSAQYSFDIGWEAFPTPERENAELIHTGSIAAFLEPGATSIRNLLQNTPGATITFDPNIRPLLLENEPTSSKPSSASPACALW